MECWLLVLSALVATVAGRRFVADLAPRETVMWTITDNKPCCEFATRLDAAWSLHRPSFSTWIGWQRRRGATCAPRRRHRARCGYPGAGRGSSDCATSAKSSWPAEPAHTLARDRARGCAVR